MHNPNWCVVSNEQEYPWVCTPFLIVPQAEMKKNMKTLGSLLMLTNFANHK